MPDPNADLLATRGHTGLHRRTIVRPVGLTRCHRRPIGARAKFSTYALTVALFSRSTPHRPEHGAWPDVADAIARATPAAEILPPGANDGPQVLARIGLAEKSTLGALVVNTGGVLVDHGWLRLLGGGSPGLPDIATASDLGAGGPAHLIVAFDALGGRFAVDGGGLGVNPGEVCHWGANTLRWAGIGCGHTAFVSWALGGGLSEFYSDLRWPGWQDETSTLGVRQGISVYPPPFTAEGREIGSASRRPVPYRELLEFYADMAAQLDGTEAGQQFRLAPTAGPVQRANDGG